jgi:hypothetical protein
MHIDPRRLQVALDLVAHLALACRKHLYAPIRSSVRQPRLSSDDLINLRLARTEGRPVRTLL